MPLIEPPPPPPKKATIALRLEVSVIDKLHLYLAYSGNDSMAHVITRSLEETYKKDKSFAPWLKAHPNFQPPSKPRRNGARQSEHYAAHSNQASTASATPGERHLPSRSSTGGA